MAKTGIFETKRLNIVKIAYLENGYLYRNINSCNKNKYLRGKKLFNLKNDRIFEDSISQDWHMTGSWLII